MGQKDERTTIKKDIFYGFTGPLDLVKAFPLQLEGVKTLYICL